MDSNQERIKRTEYSHLADSIAELCYEQYNALPKTGKPSKKEWTALAGVVMVKCWSPDKSNMQVVSLGTGSKCVGQSKLTARGDVVNDAHAEVMARRGFLRYLYHQVQLMYESGSCDVFCRVDRGKCVLDPSFSFHLFVSHTPCGDASIFPKPHLHGKRGRDEEALESCKRARRECWCNKCGNLIERQGADVFRTGAKCVEAGSLQDMKQAGTGYHVVGALRTKPGRGDATLSMSCSDKLARWSAVGVQGALLSLVLAGPVYLQSVVVAGGCPYSHGAMRRAVVDRLCGQLGAEPLLLRSSVGFVDARRCGLQPCPASIVWSAVPDRAHEVCVNGRKQGVTKKCATGWLLISKRALLEQCVRAVCAAPVLPDLIQDADVLASYSYKQLKETARSYQESWAAVKDRCFSSWVNKPRSLFQFTLRS